jgi:uncharacterized membrane protein
MRTLTRLSPSLNIIQRQHRAFPHYLVLALVMLIGISLRFWMLDQQSLWVDEGYSLFFSDGPHFQDVLSRLLETTLSDRFRMLYYFILFGWRNLVGDSEIALRTLPALLGVVSMVLIYFSARNWFGKRHALWSFGLIAISAYNVYYAQELRDYSLAFVLVSTQLLLLSQVWHGASRKTFNLCRIAFALVTAICLLQNVVMACFLGGLALAHLLSTRSAKDWFAWWWPSAVAATFPVSVYLASPVVTSPEAIGVSRFGFPLLYNLVYVIFGVFSGITYGPAQADLRGDNKLAVVISHWPELALWFAAMGAIATILAAFFVGYWRRQTKLQSIEICLLLALIFALSLGAALAYVTKLNWLPRHAFYIWPMFAILLPVILDHSPQADQLAPWKNKAANIAIALLVCVNVISLGNYYFNASYAKDDFRAATQYILAHRESDTRSVLVGGAGDTRLFSYYGDPDTLDGKFLVLQPNGDYSSQMRTLTQDAPRVLVAANREYVLGPVGLIEQEMSDLYALKEKVTFPYFTLYTFEQKPEA